MIVLAVDALGSGLFLPFSLLFFVVVAGLSVGQVGSMLAIATLLALPTGAAWGSVVDRWNARSVLVASALLRATGFGAYFLVTASWQLLLAAILVQVGDRAFYASFTPYVAELAPRTERERWFAMFGAARNAGFAVAGPLAGATVTLFGENGYRGIIVANIVSFALTAVVIGRAQAAPRPRADATFRTRGSWATVLADRRFLVLTVLNVGFAVASNVLVLALPYEAIHYFELPPWVPGLALGANTLLLTLLAGPATTVIRGRRRSAILVGASLVYAGSGMVLVAADVTRRTSLVFGLVALGVIGLTCAELLATPVMSVLSAFSGPAHVRGRYVALFQMSWSVANAVGTAGVSALLARGPGLAWWGLTVLALVTGAGTWALGRTAAEGALAQRVGSSGAAS